MTEQEMRDAEVPTFDTTKELSKYINGLVKQDHDYGTCVYAMSMAATAAFNHVARKLGVTGFQASCADMDIIKRTRNWEHGFRLLNYADLLFPQYEDKFTISFDAILQENAAWLKPAAEKLLAENGEARADVVAHWKRLTALRERPAK